MRNDFLEEVEEEATEEDMMWDHTGDFLHPSQGPDTPPNHAGQQTEEEEDPLPRHTRHGAFYGGQKK